MRKKNLEHKRKRQKNNNLTVYQAWLCPELSFWCINCHRKACPQWTFTPGGDGVRTELAHTANVREGTAVSRLNLASCTPDGVWGQQDTEKKGHSLVHSLDLLGTNIEASIYFNWPEPKQPDPNKITTLCTSSIMLTSFITKPDHTLIREKINTSVVG